MSVSVSESMTVTKFVFLTVSVISCQFPLSFQSRPVLMARVVTTNLNVSLSAWPSVRSPWLCPCITMPVSLSVSMCVSVFVTMSVSVVVPVFMAMSVSVVVSEAVLVAMPVSVTVPVSMSVPEFMFVTVLNS